MQTVIAISNKAKDVIFLKNISAFLGRYFPSDLSHTEYPALHIGNIFIVWMQLPHLPACKKIYLFSYTPVSNF